MKRMNQAPTIVADDERIQRLISALQKANGGPLMVREVAEKAGMSQNTAGKYVEICEARGQITTDWYGTVKRVWLPDAYAREMKGRGRL